jgi:phosphocarrier protein
MSAMTERITQTLRIINKRGLHARASSKFAMLAGQFEGCLVRVSKDDQEVDGESIMDLMMLAAGVGSDIEVSAQGPRAQEALDALAALVADRFGEGE